jgi:hypothetical protein
MPDKQRMHAFIDETFTAPVRADFRSFYLLAVTLVPHSELGSLRELLLEINGHDYFHSRELLQTAAGQRHLLRVTGSLPATLKHVVRHTEPLRLDDRLAEGARAAMLRAVTFEILHSEDLEIVEIVYEVRLKGAQSQADARTFSGIREAHPELVVRPRTPRDERLLWVPDLVATAVRQKLLHDRSQYELLLGSTLDARKIQLPIK